jgi:hypothetical protein
MSAVCVSAWAGRCAETIMHRGSPVVRAELCIEASGWRRCRLCRRREAMGRYYKAKGRPASTGGPAGL